MTEYDLIVIGSGPGGYATAAEAANRGRRTMIVERDNLGGTCLNRGCIPTKTLCRSAEAALLISGSASLGIDVGVPAIDYTRIAARKDEVVATLREAVDTVLSGVDIVKGEARFTAPRTIAVGENLYTATQIIIATGSQPASLPVEGAELAIDSDGILRLTELPESLAIIGGGVIGMEFASIFSSFGVKVTVLEYCREILPGFDAEIAKRLRTALKRRGVNIVTGAEVTAIHKGMSVDYIEKTRQKNIECAMVMMAVGRRAVIPEGLADLGVGFHRGFITVDDTMATSAEGIYAVGDVNGRCLLAHAATAQGRVALGLQTEPEIIPAAVFTIPECAMAGLTAGQCTEKGIDAIEGKAIYRSNGKALAMDEPEGMVKIVLERQTRRILGCHVCGAHAADLVQEATVAMQAGMTAQQLASTVHIHPTLSELMLSALNSAPV